MDELLIAGTQVPGLPNGTTPIDSIIGEPSQKPKEEQGIISTVWDVYSTFWGKAWAVLVGDEDKFYGTETPSTEIQTNQASSYSPSLLAILVIGAGALYLLRKAG